MRAPRRFTFDWFREIARLAAIGSMLLVIAVRAGVIGDDLAPVLDTLPPGQPVDVIIMLADQLDVSAIPRARVSPRWRRHDRVLREARTLAVRSQSDLLRHLESEQASGRVLGHRAFWVVNAVAATVHPDGVYDLALRGDVAVVHHDAPLQLRRARPAPAPPFSARTVVPSVSSEPPLRPTHACINARAAWDRGYTGAGRLVCLFNSGADGNHEAFSGRWRGRRPDVPWWAAWRDPYTASEFPYDSDVHGTGVLGLMVGDPPQDVPIGLAFDAEWMAAGALIQFVASEVIACYEWAVDPDGNPATIDDVPDVINNSWGTSDDCAPTFWAAIDVVEAAGVVNTIAVDNAGPGEATVNSPESRADSPFVNFSVGTVNPNAEGCPIANSSARGPSPCDGVSIKPELTAPGTVVYTTIPGDDYLYLSGTSMACPHVSAAVALLRQVNPDLEVETIKDILMRTARDQGEVGEDNAYGFGVLDAGAAVAEAIRTTLPRHPPRDLGAEPAPPDDVMLSWSAPISVESVPDVLDYAIYRTVSGEEFPDGPLAIVSDLAFRDVGVPPGSWMYAVTARYPAGESGPAVVEIRIDRPMVETGGVTDAPGATAPILRAAPNPSSGAIEFDLDPTPRGRARIVITDAGGRAVRVLDVESAGSVHWDGRDAAGRALASGVYFAILEQDGTRTARRLVFLR